MTTPKETTPTAPVEPTPSLDATPQGEDKFHDFHVLGALQKVAEDHHVPMDFEGIKDWGRALAGRHDTHSGAVQEFTKYIQQMASGLYPTLAPQIQQGLPVKALLDPYRMLAKQVLGHEVEPNFADPHWNKALTGNIDEKTGRAAPMSLEHWRQELLTNPAFGYSKTERGQEQQAAVLNELHTLLHTPRKAEQ